MSFHHTLGAGITALDHAHMRHKAGNRCSALVRSALQMVMVAAQEADESLT